MGKIFLSITLSLLALSPMLAKTNISIVTDNTQLVLQVKDNGRVYQTYLGERLADAVDLNILEMPRTNVTQSLFAGNEAYPVLGTEDFYDGAMEIKHYNGNHTSVLKYISHTSKTIDGGVETIVNLRDELYPVKVVLHYLAFSSENIIKQYAEISHEEKAPITLYNFASSMLYFEAGSYFLTEFGSDWAKEMNIIDQELKFGKKIIDSRLGTRANLLAQPFFEVGIGSKVQEESGTVLMGTLAWTGNFRFTFEVDHNNELRVISGINPAASAFLLKKGEVFKTPEFIFTMSYCGIGEGSRNFQKWALKYQLNKGDQDRMTLLNNWENTSFSFDEDKLSALFDEAKNLGVDLFLLDDGWFGNKYPRNSDRQGLGDWQPNKEKLPHGIPHLVTTANEKGVEFGIWIEPEMVNPKSELAEKHPDWILKLPNRDTYYFRNQLVLDLTNPKVQDFVYGIVDGLMKENPKLKYMKWDCNSPITNAFSNYQKENQGNLYINYVQGLYKVLKRIKAKYPNLYMMMCSGGGGRSDFEGLKYFTEFWLSDNTDPVERLRIQWGYSHFMPSKAMCAHVTNWNGSSSVKFRVDVALACKLGFDIDLKSLSAENLSYCHRAIKEYNRLKPVIFSPYLYRLVSPIETTHCVFQRVNDTKGHSLVFAYDVFPRIAEPIQPTRLKGLDPNARYEVKEILLTQEGKSNLSCHNKVYSGDYLMKVGIKVLSTSHMNSHIIEIAKQ